MPAPDATVELGACRVRLLGTIAGFVPDGERVRAAFAAFAPDGVALGVPPEDVATLGVLASGPPPEDLPEPDPQQARLLELLQPFGGTRVPSPDLEAAFAAAAEAKAPVLALDLDDAAHAKEFTARVGMMAVLRHNRQQRRILRETFPAASDAYALAAAFDARLHRMGALREVEAARAAHMAKRLREAAKAHRRVLAIVPAARWADVLSLLRREPS